MIVSVEELVGKVLIDIKQIEDRELIFTTSDGDSYKMYHSQDCCEQVYIEDICGDLSDLIGNPILVAEERTNKKFDPEEYESVTWTFYQFDTIKGGVNIRWCGISNGYYSESVDFEKLTEDDE